MDFLLRQKKEEYNHKYWRQTYTEQTKLHGKKCYTSAAIVVFFFLKIDLIEVIEVIESLKNKDSTDCYDINTVLVKHLKIILAGPLTEIFNDCLTSGIYPSCLKIAKIVPIFKEGDPSDPSDYRPLRIYPSCLKIAKIVPIFKEGDPIDDPSDYRPISLLPVLGKIFERIISKRAQSHVDKFNIIRNTQFGFRSNRSSVDAILTLLEEVSTSLSNKKLTVQNTFLDLTKAFDTVDHSNLLIKMEQMGFREPVLNLLESYLNNRYQYIETNSFKTELKLVSFGVPQGSILGPLLFILFINDLQIATKNTGELLYADDTVLKFANNKDYIAFAHRLALLEVNDGFDKNKLTLNVKKTKTMRYCRSTKTEERPVNYFLNDTQIEDIECFKYLGILLDCKLNFHQHIDKVGNKILQFCGVFFQLRKFLTGQQLIFAFKSYAQPIIQYGVLFYANTDKTKLLELELKIRRLIRIISYKHRMDSITEIMHDNKIYTVREFFAYEVLKLTGKIIRKECQVETLRYSITEQELNVIFSKRKTNQKLAINRNKLDRGSITTKIRKMFNFVINFSPPGSNS